MDEHHSDIGAWSKSVLESLTASSIQLRKQVQKLVSETATHLSTSDEKVFQYFTIINLNTSFFSCKIIYDASL